MEAAPAGTDPDAIGDRLATVHDVTEVHDLHVWEITSGEAALSAHVLVTPGSDCHAVRRDLQGLLRSEYRIGHATLQVDHASSSAGLAERPAGPPDCGPGAHCEDAHGPVHLPGPHQH
jgi:cobalt-zinc-cadmium efflux system protein